MKSISRVRPTAVLTGVALVLGLGLFAYSRGLYYYAQFFFNDLFGEMTRFGEDCGVAVGEWQQGDDFAAVAARPHATTALAMPYRAAPPEAKPKVGANQYLYTRCNVDLSKLAATGFGWMRLHFVHGESAIFLNGSLRQTLGDLGTAEFPLLPGDRRAASELVVISRPNALKNDRLGLPTAMPLVATDDRGKLGIPNIGGYFDFTIRPAYWLNWSLVFLFVFALAWLGGMRTLDIGWIIVALAANATMNLVLFSTDNSYTPLTGIISRAAVMATHMGFAAFAWTYVRRSSEKIPLFAFLLVVVGYAALNVWTPSFLNSRNLSLDIPAAIQILAYGGAAIGGLLFLRKFAEAKTRRTLFVVGFCALLAVARIADLIVYQTTLLTFVEVLSELGMTGFCGFLVYDLVVYHRRYLEARVCARELEAVAQTTQMLAHDVRKPFSTLKIALEAIAASDDARYIQRIAGDLRVRVERDRARAEALLADVMEVGAERRYEVEPQLLSPMVDEALDMVMSAAMRQVPVTKDIPADAWVAVDRTRLLRVLVNVLDNALQATPDGGQITVKAAKRGGRVEISVHNTGSFVPETDREKLFEPFFTKGKKGGTGLGLAVTRKIVAGHGGDIRCESDGAGTQFVWDVANATPVVKHAKSDVCTREIVRASKGALKLRVAFVDDDVFLTDVWASTLKAFCDVRTFNAPSELKAAITEGATFDAVVTDYYFGGDETGADLRAWLRTVAPGLPVAVCTELRANELAPNAFDAVLGKEPLSEEQLSTLACR